MLNAYFALGVPLALLVLYLILEIVRMKTHIHYYIGFVLLLIAAFMTLFSFQVLQELWASNTNTDQLFGYPPEVLWFPLLMGAILVVLNCWRGLKRIFAFLQLRKQEHPEQK